MKRDRGLGSSICVIALLAVGCSGEDLAKNPALPNGQHASSAKPKGTRTVPGVLLAHADITATHSVEFWQTIPGSVMMLQRLNVQAGDKSLDLGPMLLDAGGTYAGLYRKLLHDPNAQPSPGLIAADQRRSHLPIRDASLPLPKSAPPPRASRTHGAEVVRAPQTPAQPGGALRTQAIETRVDHYDNEGITDFDCSAPEVDTGWCPPYNFNDFAYDNSDEAIYYDSAGYNPQGDPPPGHAFENDDEYVILQGTQGGGWVSLLDWSLVPGETLRVTVVDTPAYYYAEVDGGAVGFADRWRLSFPSLSLAYNDPPWGTDEGTFANNVEGLAHGYGILPLAEAGIDPSASMWFQSRTEYSSPLPGFGTPTSLHGQIGIGDSLSYGEPYDDCTYDEPSAWHQGTDYAHYGDIVYQPKRTSLPNDRSSSGFLIVSLNAADNTHAGVGFLGVQPADANCGYELQDWGTLALSASEQAPCVAITNKYYHHIVEGNFESDWMAHIYIPSSATNWNSLHEYIIDYSGTPRLVWNRDVTLVNAVQFGTSVGGPNGMKVSSHGKLYVWGVATQYQVGRLYGIDPFSGVIQVQYDINYGTSGGVAQHIESEGLDIIDTTDVNLTSAAPEILLQVLADSPSTTIFGDAQWEGVHISISDPSRL